MGKKIKIAVVDDHKIVRNGIASLLSERYDITIQAGDGMEFQELLAAADRHIIPDLVTLDINMPRMNGYETAEWIKSNYPDMKILGLSMFDNEFSIIKLIRSGAHAFLHKGADKKELFEAIEQVIKSGNYFRGVSSILAESVKNDHQFTERELEYLQLISSDLSMQEIAAKMYLSPRTVDYIRETLSAKLKINTRTGLAIYALKNNIID